MVRELACECGAKWNFENKTLNFTPSLKRVQDAKKDEEKAVRDFINWFVSPNGAINIGTQTTMNMMHSAASRYFEDKKTAPKG